jgi:hypothetical protein
MNAIPAKKGYKWIAREIQSLDPEIDYARIWALTTIYYGDDTLVNLLYAVGMPCFIQSPFGSTLLVDRSRKAIDRGHDRANDTLAHFWRWFEYGPDHVEAWRSIERVNLIHEAMAKMVPEAFTNDDFIYTTAWLATYLHRLRLMVGLSGFSPKQKIAAHHFWRGIAAKMRGPHGLIVGYPLSFDALEAFVDAFEARPWPRTEAGKRLSEYTIRQFNEACLPRFLHGLGRQLILTCQARHVRDLHRMGDPNLLASWLLKKILAVKIAWGERLAPDPRLSAPERARAGGWTDGQHREPPLVPASSCPFRSLKSIVSAGP